MTDTATKPKGKKVRVIPADPHMTKSASDKRNRIIRVAAYCRVSTQEEEQLNSYEVQCRYYREKIQNEPTWKLAGIFADRGISGTSTKKRDEFNKMIRACQRDSIDMIITKSISRFARNTADCLKYVHKLSQLNVVVFFEEQGIKSTDTNAELYITIYGSIAQSESENISKNVSWGLQQRAREGKVSFGYSSFLGYRKGDNGEPEIVPEEAETVRRIYSRYLAGDSLQTIADELTADGIPSPAGKPQWCLGTIKSILTNVKYKGDAILNRTFVHDVLSKKIVINRGERPMIYVENSHEAIIDADTFAKVQKEMARRRGRSDTKRTDLKTKLGKHSSKYALTDILICGECGSAYRRTLWKIRDEYVPVWRCIGRLNKHKTCFHSPTMYEDSLHEAIMEAVKLAALQNMDLLDQLKRHICMGLSEDFCEDRTLEIRVRLAEIDAEFNELLNGIDSAISTEDYDDSAMRRLMEEKHSLEDELASYADDSQRQASRLDDILTVVEGIHNHPLPFNDPLIYQMLDTVTVESADRIKVLFRGGLEIEQAVYRKRKKDSAD